jgi:7-keto-8-aminopelargonate synthetase-like enzyme
VLHERLEKELAAFFHKEAALTFSTGFQTNAVHRFVPGGISRLYH